MAKKKVDSIDFDEACAPSASQIRWSQVMEFDNVYFLQKSVTLLIVDILIGGTG